MKKDGPTDAGLGRDQKELRELWKPQSRLPTRNSVSEAVSKDPFTYLRCCE